MSTQIRQIGLTGLAFNEFIHVELGLIRGIGISLTYRAGVAGQTPLRITFRALILNKMRNTGRDIVGPRREGLSRTGLKTGFVGTGFARGCGFLNLWKLDLVVQNQGRAIGMPKTKPGVY